MSFLSPKAPTAQAAPAALPPPPTLPDQQVAAAGTNTRAAALAAAASNGTNPTGPQGVTSPALTDKKNLTGQ